jgi:ABC-type transport system, involved in lipoprotein release, permease component
MFIPTLLYNTTQSVMNKVEQSHKAVFGNFTDIYYDSVLTDNPTLDFSDNDFKAILPDFHYERFGVFFTTYQQELSSNKTLYVGYADNEALSLAEVTILEGTLPKNNNEIALTQGIATLFGNKILGEQVGIAGSTYTISGLIQDFGHLWPKGELQIERKISPVNAFVTSQEAKHLLKQTGELTRQILVERQLGISNSIENNSYFFRNVNNSLENQKKFIVPNEFRYLIYITSIVIIFMVLSLNRRRLTERLKYYYLLGLIKSEIGFIIHFELFFLSIIGLFIGVILGCGATFFALKLLSSFIRQPIPLIFDIFSLVILFIVLFAGVSVLILIFSRYMVNRALREEQLQVKKKQQRVKRTHLLGFELKLGRRNLVSLTLLIVFAFSLLSYGVFYGNYFTRDIFEAPVGTLPRDYDFQFIARPQTAPPLAKGEKAFYFTDTFEKIGATDEFINEILSEPAVKNVKAYKEINKINILLKENQIDDYIDAFDYYSDGKYNPQLDTRFVNVNFVRENFDYQSDDIFVGGEILAYPSEVLKSLTKSVVEGTIDLGKIISGEEVVLRVPAYTIKELENGGIRRMYVPYTQEGSYNSTTFKVGDEIHLSGLLTNELFNGPIRESQVKSYYRRDVIVKVGAIIRDTDGLFPSHGFVGGKPFSILTVNEALTKMNIPATYSIVSIYTKDGYDSNDLSKIIANYSYKVPNMILEDWQSDIKTYKVFNLLVYIFVLTLLSVLILTTLTVLMSQLLIKTQLSMKNYALLRINGLSFWGLIRLLVLQVCLIIGIGSLIGVPVSLITIQYFGIRARFEILHQIFYYFPVVYLLYIFISIVAISIISMIPCLIYLTQRRDNILFDIH